MDNKYETEGVIKSFQIIDLSQNLHPIFFNRLNLISLKYFYQIFPKSKSNPNPLTNQKIPTHPKKKKKNHILSLYIILDLNLHHKTNSL